jgi:hypothetical protein
MALTVTITYGISANLSGKDTFLTNGSQQPGAVNSMTPFMTDLDETKVNVNNAIINRFCII